MRGDAGVGMLVYAIEVTMEWRGAVCPGGKPERRGAGIRGLARCGHGSGATRVQSGPTRVRRGVRGTREGSAAHGVGLGAQSDGSVPDSVGLGLGRTGGI